ncbi:MAG: sigma-70 family RNA polymerase sigma factor [Acidimicrobiales bacterium]|nr:sigma-70 family RNA polymerase sigma factor [Acidimicrobiales bacterium]HRW36346.1 sigma-70 family RNA polymerase sigma factor [Aquihabitans sp.]
MRSSASDEDLVALARTGDRPATEELLRRHQPRVHAVCRRMVGNDADALDATQDALMAIVRGLPRFDGRAAFSTWCYRIATNASLDELRRRRRRPVVGLPEHDGHTIEPADRAAAGAIDRVVDADELDAALASLSPEFRAAVVLRDQCQLDYAEIADVLEIPPGTVRSRIARGRAQLADLLRGNQTDPDARRTPAP